MSDTETHDALRQALRAVPALAGLAEGRLVRLSGRGIAHDHVLAPDAAIDGAVPLLRLPRVSQWGLAAELQLAYEATAFSRAAPSGATPRLLATIAPGDSLPMGALAVEYVDGRKPHLPADLPAIASCLARLHRLAVPPPESRGVLLTHADPVAETLAVIRGQAAFLDRAGLAPDAAAMIREELAAAEQRAGATAGLRGIEVLTGTDTHPGNFLLAGAGRTVFVDLEKALYGNPAIDLAHATLYTSTMWDPDCARALAPEDIAAFYAAYAVAAGPALAAAVRPWTIPLRRLIWLRTLTWCVRWRVVSHETGGWSSARLGAEHAAYIARNVADYVAPARIAAIRTALDAEAALLR